MQITKPTLLSLATVLAVTIPSASAGEVKFELDTDSNGDKPNNPLFACTVKSRRCKSVSHFDNVKLQPFVDLSVCYHPNFFHNIFDRFMPDNKHGYYTNNLYVSCPANDKHCGHEMAGKSRHQMSTILANGIGEQTKCDALVQCFWPEEVDEKCFKK